MFTFTNDCLIGVPEIDEEHRTLFELISKTDSALKTGDGSITEALTLLNELKQYAKNHFTHEEAYMESIHDAELPRQKKNMLLLLKK